MKLAFIEEYRPARVDGAEVIDLSDVVGSSVMDLDPEDRVRAILGSDAATLARMAGAGGPRRALSLVRLRAPVLRPSKMLFALANYPEEPGGPKSRINLGLKAPTSILDPGGTVILPSRDAKVFQPEPELAVIIGRPARRVARADALSHVFGYTAVLDVTARGLGYGMGVDSNSFDTFCPMGPWIVTADEIPDPQGLRIRHWQDGALRADYSTAEMEHAVADLIAWASHVGRLETGDVIACGVSHQRLGALQDGERMRLEIESIGVLEAQVHDPLNRRWPKGVDLSLARAAAAARRDGVPLNMKAAVMSRLED